MVIFNGVLITSWQAVRNRSKQLDFKKNSNICAVIGFDF